MKASLYYQAQNQKSRVGETSDARGVSRLFQASTHSLFLLNTLEATEFALREMGQRVSGRLLEKLLNAGGNIPRTDVVCGKVHGARFTGLRPKQLVTVVGSVKLERGYYYCAQCVEGVMPEDRARSMS